MAMNLLKLRLWSRLKTLGIALLWLLPLLATSVWLLANPEKTLALAALARENAVALMMLRWLAYATLVLWAWPAIARHVVLGSRQLSKKQAQAQYESILAWRWRVARFLVVYELLFPLNLLARLGDWL